MNPTLVIPKPRDLQFLPLLAEFSPSHLRPYVSLCKQVRLYGVPNNFVLYQSSIAFSDPRGMERATPNHPPKRVPHISPCFGEMWVGCIRRRKPRSDSPKMPFPTAR